MPTAKTILCAFIDLQEGGVQSLPDSADSHRRLVVLGRERGWPPWPGSAQEGTTGLRGLPDQPSSTCIG